MTPVDLGIEPDEGHSTTKSQSVRRGDRLETLMATRSPRPLRPPTSPTPSTEPAENGWLIVQNPSDRWEKIELPRKVDLDADEELRRIMDRDSIWEFVKVCDFLCFHLPMQARA